MAGVFIICLEVLLHHEMGPGQWVGLMKPPLYTLASTLVRNQNQNYTLCVCVWVWVCVCVCVCGWVCVWGGRVCVAFCLPVLCGGQVVTVTPGVLRCECQGEGMVRSELCV